MTNDNGRQANGHEDQNESETIDTQPTTQAQSPIDLTEEPALAEAEGNEAQSDPMAALVGDLKAVHAEKDDLQNQLLRTVADMENLRKRTRKEIADAREFSISSFAKDMLSVADNLRRAIDAVSEEAAESSNDIKTLLEGVAMTEKELLNVMEKHGVKQISPQGEKFDPNKHQALFEVPNPELPNNTVVEVVQTGYVIGERVLRPAMVGVSKGGPKTNKAKEEPQA